MKKLKETAACLLALLLLTASCTSEGVAFNQESEAISKSTDPDVFNELQFNIQKIAEQKGQNSEIKLLDADQEKPEYLDTYLAKMGKENEDFSDVTHLKFDTNEEYGVVDQYTLRYANDPTKYLTIIEGNFEQNIAYDMTLSIKELSQSSPEDPTYSFVPVLTDGSVEIIELPNPNITLGSKPYKFSKGCFKNCMDGAMGYDSTVGNFVFGLGIAASFGCGPCGAVAATYSAVVLVGCGGGCITRG